MASDEWIDIDEFCKIFETTRSNIYTIKNQRPELKAFTKKGDKRMVISKALLKKRDEKLQNREFCQKRYYELIDDVSEMNIAKYLASKSDRFKSCISWYGFVRYGMWREIKIKIGMLFMINMTDEMSRLLKNTTANDIKKYYEKTSTF